jgi:hypothetical protein
MTIWEILEWAAWAVSALLMLWMLVDASRVGIKTDERTLLSSREGVDELFADQNKKG